MRTARSVLVLALALVISACTPVQKAVEDTIQVQAQGEALAIPDMASMRFTVSEQGDDLSVLKAAVDNTTANFLATLQRLGIAREQISSWQLDVQPRYEYRDSRQLFMGYQVNRTIQVQLLDLTWFDSVIDSALSEGIGRVQQVQFAVADPAPVYSQARAQAMAQAWLKAEELARASQRQIARVQQVVEYGAASAQPERSMAFATRMDSVSEPGQQGLTVQVQVTFVLE